VSVQERFVHLAGGAGKARIALLPMASTDYDEEAQEVISDLKKLGADVTLLDLDRAEAQNESVAKKIGEYTGFWFSGGDQSRLSRFLEGTRVLAAIEAGYRSGAVIGGTSAGASVMTSVMLTGKRRAPKTPTEIDNLNVMKGMQEVSKGFGFFQGAIVDQHFMHRARYNRLLSAVVDYPHLLGVGIDEETALLVRPDGKWEVLGEYYVKVFDARRARIIGDNGPLAAASNIRMHILSAGSFFDPKNRRVTLVDD